MEVVGLEGGGKAGGAVGICAGMGGGGYTEWGRGPPSFIPLLSNTQHRKWKRRQTMRMTTRKNVGQRKTAVHRTYLLPYLHASPNVAPTWRPRQVKKKRKLSWRKGKYVRVAMIVRQRGLVSSIGRFIFLPWACWWCLDLWAGRCPPSGCNPLPACLFQTPSITWWSCLQKARQNKTIDHPKTITPRTVVSHNRKEHFCTVCGKQEVRRVFALEPSNLVDLLLDLQALQIIELGLVALERAVPM